MEIPERRMTLDQVQDLLAKVLPLDKNGEEHRPSHRLLYQWMERKVNPMPWIPKPGTGTGTGKRIGRWFLASQVLAWLDDPPAYWAKRLQEGGTVPPALAGRRGGATGGAKP